tara:strand:+ start:425 stop:1618 length:1194 start_codon:yes stop_codon:yes gene_type:complete
MKICHIVGHGDQRAIKECLALKKKGHEIIFLTRNVNSYTNFFDAYKIWGSDETLVAAIKSTEADIFHVHCKPANIPAVSIRTLKEMGKKWVYDVHDLDIVRFQRTNHEELYALLNSEWLIFPDKGIEELTMKLLFDHVAVKPRSLVLLPYFSLTDMVYPCIQPNPAAVQARVNEIVYEGNVIVPAIENLKRFPYYDLRFTSHILSSYGYRFHIYPVGIDFNQVRQYYDTSDAVLHPPVEYPTLVKEMSQYGWGFFGAFVKSQQASSTFANKVFDYICAGLPVAVMNAENQGKWLEETGFGIQIKGFEDIENLRDIDRWQRLQQNVLGERVKYSMEERIGPLEEFYAEVLDNSNRNSDNERTSGDIREKIIPEIAEQNYREEKYNNAILETMDLESIR